MLRMKSDPKSGGRLHAIPFNWVDKVDEHVYLNKAPKDVMSEWPSAA